tara:strand:+ start:3201 stop:3542 length:342 start_codon:yes stop_codon:yes gene_type:complete
MSEKSDKIKITINSGKFGQYKIKNGRRMKLYIKLNQNETQQWEALREALTGNNVGNDELARVMFLRGVMAFTKELNERIESMSDEEKAELLNEAGIQETDVKVEDTNENNNES